MAENPITEQTKVSSSMAQTGNARKKSAGKFLLHELGILIFTTLHVFILPDTLKNLRESKQFYLIEFRLAIVLGILFFLDRPNHRTRIGFLKYVFLVIHLLAASTGVKTLVVLMWLPVVIHVNMAFAAILCFFHEAMRFGGVDVHNRRRQGNATTKSAVIQILLHELGFLIFTTLHLFILPDTLKNLSESKQFYLIEFRLAILLGVLFFFDRPNHRTRIGFLKYVFLVIHLVAARTGAKTLVDEGIVLMWLPVVIYFNMTFAAILCFLHEAMRFGGMDVDNQRQFTVVEVCM